MKIFITESQLKMVILEQSELPISTEGTPLAGKSVDDVYSFIIGLSTETSSLSMKKGNIDAAGAFKEISKHYQSLRDKKSPLSLTDNAKRYLPMITTMLGKIDDSMIQRFIESGKQIRTIN